MHLTSAGKDTAARTCLLINNLSQPEIKMIKKITKFVSSMKFGMLLLVLILICSLAGSFIPGGDEIVFSSWYFISLLSFLCINLIFCSIIRLKNTIRKVKQGLKVAGSATCQPTDKEDLGRIVGFFESQRYKIHKSNDATIYYRNINGYYGSFLVHLSILFILVFGACAMHFSTMEDLDIMVGESAVLADGTEIMVESFQVVDENRETDYESVLKVRDKHGNVSESAPVSVNYPFSFGGHKYYQQTYGLAGYITVTNKGIASPLYMKEEGFITLDNQNGLIYFEVYPDYKRNQDGSLALSTDLNKGYSNPIYKVAVLENGKTTEGMALPGTSIQVGDMVCFFNDPVFYPGIRVKSSPAIIMALLYLSFALMIVGLWLCFFHVPLYVKIDDIGYVLISPKSTEGIKVKMSASIDFCDREENK